jgi:hypothetical protein
MTPKEKAQELYNKMYALDECDYMSKHLAKATALIAVDEIIKQTNYCFVRCADNSVDYWQEVKQEIEKL